MTRIGAAVLGVSVLFAAPDKLFAKPLPTEACTRLADEYAQLVRSGVEEAMQAEPVAARDALKPDELASIERFLFIEGQIRFRCPEISLPKPKVPEQPQTHAVEIETKEAEKPAAGPPVPLPRRKPARAVKQAG